MIDVQKAHFWIFFVNSEKTKFFDQNIFLLKFCFTKSLPIIFEYVLALCGVFVTPYRFFQYLHPKGIKFDFFFIKIFQGIAEISAQKCTFWVQILPKFCISQSKPPSAHFTFWVSKTSKYNKSYETIYKSAQKLRNLDSWGNKNIYQGFPMQKATLLIFYTFQPNEK